MMLNEKEIYLLGKGIVDEIKDDYYCTVLSDDIRKDPKKLINKINIYIAKLMRVKTLTREYDENNTEYKIEENMWI